MNAQQSLKALPAVARFARAGNFDLARATDLVTDAQTAMGLSSKNSSANLRNLVHVSDVLVGANTIANASTEQFSEALTNGLASALRQVDKPLEEGVALLAAFAQQGIKGADAGTAASIVMRDLQTKAIANKEAFAAMGVKVYDAAGKMQSLPNVIHDLEKALSGASDEQKKATLLTLGFSDKSVKYVQAVLGMSDAIREYQKQLEKMGGTTKEVADKMLTDWQKAKAEFGESWSAAVEPATNFFTAAGTGATRLAAKTLDAITITQGYSQMFGELFGFYDKQAEKQKRMDFQRRTDFSNFKNPEKASIWKNPEKILGAKALLPPKITIDAQLGTLPTVLMKSSKDMLKTLALQKQQQAQMHQPIPALQYGSNQTLSAINRMRQESKSHEAKVENILDDQKTELKKQTEELRKIKEKLGEGGAVTL